MYIHKHHVLPLMMLIESLILKNSTFEFILFQKSKNVFNENKIENETLKNAKEKKPKEKSVYKLNVLKYENYYALRPLKFEKVNFMDSTMPRAVHYVPLSAENCQHLSILHGSHSRLARSSVPTSRAFELTEYIVYSYGRTNTTLNLCRREILVIIFSSQRLY